jgi:hypothetical protein
MKSTGVAIPEEAMGRIRVLMRGDRRPLGWIVREAIAMYLTSRADDISTYEAKFAAELGQDTRQTAQHETDKGQTSELKVVSPPYSKETNCVTGNDK